MVIKNIVLNLCIVLCCSFSLTQSQESTPIIDAGIAPKKYYTFDDLKNLSKGELITIYKERYKVIIKLLPFTALNVSPGTTLEEAGIPEKKENKDLIDKEKKAAEAHFKTTDATIDVFLAFAEKNDIIWSIITYDEMIKKLLLGRE